MAFFLVVRRETARRAWLVEAPDEANAIDYKGERHVKYLVSSADTVDDVESVTPIELPFPDDG